MGNLSTVDLLKINFTEGRQTHTGQEPNGMVILECIMTRYQRAQAGEH